MQYPQITQMNIELSSLCDKQTFCSFCGHQDSKVNPQPKGWMTGLVRHRVFSEIPFGCIVQLHRDGDPLAYPDLGQALGELSGHFVSIVTHGEKLGEKAGEIIGACNSITVSVIPNDPDRDIQIASIDEFLQKKLLSSSPDPSLVNLKVVGEIDDEELALYSHFKLPVIRRALHSKKNNAHYAKMNPVAPEIGICLDFLHHPSVDIYGNVYICNRLDPGKQGLIGNLMEESLRAIWMGEKRTKWLWAHMRGRREDVPLCSTCTYWGIPVAS